MAGAGRYVDVHVPRCTWKHALNTQHTPTHDMLPHPYTTGMFIFIVILARIISAL